MPNPSQIHWNAETATEWPIAARGVPRGRGGNYLKCRPLTLNHWNRLETDCEDS